METAVTELAVVQIRFLGTFTSQFGNPCNGLAFLFRLLDFLEHHLGHLRILVQVIVHLRLDEIAYELVDARTGRLVFLRNGRPHVVRAELGLGLAFKHRFFHIQRNGCHNPVADIGKLLVLVVEFLDGTCNVFLQRTLMGTSLGGMLTVHEGIVFLTVLVGVREGDFDILTFQMNDVVQAIGGHVVLQQVFQSVTRHNALTVVDESQTRIQIGIVSE